MPAVGGRAGAAGVTRSTAPLATIVESDCAVVLARGRRITVLTERSADSGLLVRVTPTLRALGGGPAAGAGAVIFLGPGSPTCDLSFSPGHGGAALWADGNLDDLAVAAALTARLVGVAWASPQPCSCRLNSNLIEPS